MHDEELQKMICLGLKKWNHQWSGMDSAMVTTLRMVRNNLVSKERIDVFYYGPKNAGLAKAIGIETRSVCDDFGEFFGKIQTGEEVVENRKSFCLPTLTEEEMNLLEEKNEDHLHTYFLYYSGHNHERMHPELKWEMLLSESNSKYVQISCQRQTSLIKKSSLWNLQIAIKAAIITLVAVTIFDWILSC